MHSTVAQTASAASGAAQPSNAEVFQEGNPEPESLRSKSLDVFTKTLHKSILADSETYVHKSLSPYKISDERLCSLLNPSSEIESLSQRMSQTLGTQ